MIGRQKSKVVANAIKTMVNQSYPNRKKRKLSALLMLSGGMDSTSLLINILKETDQFLHVHHIEIQNFENRVIAEIDAINNVKRYCQNHLRQFSFSSSKSEFNIGLGGGYDLTLVLFTAARVHTALGQNIDIIYTGDKSPQQSVLIEGASVFNACYINKRYKPKWLRPLDKLNKLQIYESIPTEIANQTWSCRKPVYCGNSYNICGKCHTCRSLTKILNR